MASWMSDAGRRRFVVCVTRARVTCAEAIELGHALDLAAVEHALEMMGKGGQVIDT